MRRDPCLLRCTKVNLLDEGDIGLHVPDVPNSYKSTTVSVVAAKWTMLFRITKFATGLSICQR